MGCVHGRPTTSSPAPAATSSRRRDHPTVTQPQQEGVDSSDAATAAAAAAPEQQAAEKPEKVKRERRSRSSRSAAAAAAHAEVRLGGSFANKARGEQVAAGWPAWLSAVAGEAIDGWTPRRADSFEKIDKVRPFLRLPTSVIRVARTPR
jgi:cyclin-dependent kinase 12/13